MPTPQEIEAYLRQMGQSATQQGQDMVNQNIDQPLQAKLKALQQASGQSPNMIPGGAPQGGVPGSNQYQPPQPQVDQMAPNDPTMSGADQNSRTNAMIAAPDQMAQAAAKLRMQAALDGQQQQHQNDIETQDMSGYSDVPHPGLRQFPGLQKKIQAKQPVTADDIRSMTSPSQALTPEQEAKINGQLSGKDDEDEE